MSPQRLQIVWTLSAAFIAASSLLLVSCTEPVPPIDNPLDPLGTTYDMYHPILGTPMLTGPRQVSLVVYSPNLYTAYIEIERRDGLTGEFHRVAKVPPSEPGYIDVIPPTTVIDFWYRARYQSMAGNFSSYSSTNFIRVP